ncbi:AIDA repeat-containing protein, partial [Leptospira borgpetersenii serovar Hardjo-bovis]|nr:AIDA repeat-containing protein [Leptospira borgpetersenii serovar Hardjo-bovis]
GSLVNAGGLQNVDGTAASTVVDGDGIPLVNSGGLGRATTVNSGGLQNVDGTANYATINNGGVQLVQNGGHANSAVVRSGGVQDVKLGGAASDSVLLGGIQSVSGTAGRT